MKLTEGALSMLLKRYRAVLCKCRTLNWIAGTVLAGGLVLGATTGALAANPNIWTKAEDVTATENFTTEALILEKGTFAIDGTQTPAGINLTVRGGAEVTIDGSGTWSETSLFGYSAAADADNAAPVPTTITDLGTVVTVTKGSVGAGLPGDGNGAGYQFTIDNGANVVLNGTNENEAVIHAFAAKANQLTTTISGLGTVVEVADGKKGTFSAPFGKVTVSGGAILGSGGELSLIAGGLSHESAIYDRTKATTATFSIDYAGTLAVDIGGSITVNKGVTVALTEGGNISNGGTLTATDGGHVDMSQGLVMANDVGAVSLFKVESDSLMTFSQANLENALKGKIDINGGTVSVDALTIDGGKLKNAAPSAAGEIGFSAAAGVLKATELNVTGDAIGAADGSNTGTLEANQMFLGSGNSVAVNKFVLSLTGDNARLSLAQPQARADAVLTLGTNATLLASGTDAVVDAPVELTDATTTLEVKDGGSATFEKDVTVTKGTLTVEGGTTATMGEGATLSFAGDADAKATIDGTLDVRKGTLETKTSSAVTVNTGGVVNATADALGIKAEDGDATSSTVATSTLTAKAGSIINIEGLTEVASANAAGLVSAVTGGAGGVVNVGAATIEGVDDNISPEGTIDAGKLVTGITNDALSKATATGVDDASKVKGAVAGVQLSATKTVLAYTNVNDQTVNLLGSSDNPEYKLVTKDDGTLAGVTFDSTATGQVLTLGAGDRNNSGQIGTVTFAKGDQVFNALGNATGPGDSNAGTFNVESFAVTSDNDGTVNVSGVKVITKAVGDSTSKVGAVKVTNGVLSVDKGAAGDSIIKTNTLEVANGSVSARDGITVASTTTIGGDGTVAVTDKGDISFTGAVTMDGGNAGTTDGNITFGDALTANDGKNTVTATGDLTVTGAVTAANEGTALTLTADGGDLTLTGGADGSAPGVTLNLRAIGGNIASTSAEIKATSLVATAKDDGTKGDITVTGQNITAPVVVADGTIAANDLTAIGADERKAIVAANKLTASGNVAVENGTFNLTGNKDDGSTDSTVTGTLNLTNAESTVAGKLDVTGAAAIDGGVFTGLEGSAVAYGDTLDIKGGARATYDTLEMAASKTLTVGDAADAASTSLAVKTLKLAGSGLSASGAEGAPALVAVSDFAGSPAGGRVTADGDVTAGVNSVVGLGVDSLADLQARVAEAAGKGMSAGSTLVIGKPVAMGSNQLTVGATPGKIGADSLTIVSAATAQITKTSGGAITIDAAPGVENGARLYLPGARVGGKYAVFTTDGTTPADMSAQLEGKGWQGDNLKSDALMVNLAWNADKTAIEGELRPAGDVYPKLDKELQNVLNSAYLSGQLPDVNSDSRGVRFLSRATSAEYIGANADLAAQTIEGAARMITIGAVPQMTRAANQAAGEAVTQRTGLAQPAGIRTQEAGDHFALWIMPLYQSVNGFGMEAGNFDADFSGGLGGVAIGADYTFENAIRAGIAFNIGGGYATGGGDFADTRNNMNFWGIGAYAGWTRNNFGLAADVNFTSAYNKLGQDLPSAMGMGDLKADVRSYAFSTGLKGEYKLETSVLDIIPHVGVRYMYLTTEDYDVKSGGTVLKGDAVNQNIWTFPVGVSFSKNIDAGNGWRFKPTVDLSVIPAAGDIKAKENVRFTGTDYKAELETRIMDYVTYQGGLGFEVGKENFAFGVNGNMQFGAKTSGFGVLGTFRYEF